MSKLENILTTLFHSYNARGNQLVIDESKQQIKDLFIELAETHEVLFASREMYEEFRKAIQEEL